MLEKSDYREYEIRIYITLTGFMLRAYKDNRAFYPFISVDYDHYRNARIKEGKSELETIIAFLKAQIDRNLLIPIG